MKAIIPYKVKTLAEAQPGELIIIPGHGEDIGDIAVVLVHKGDDTHLVVVQSGAKDKGPELKHYDRNAECISYGTDWVLEVDQKREFCDYGDGRGKIGYVAVTRDAVFFCGGRDQQNVQSGVGYVHLHTLKIVNVPVEATFTNQWRIWTDASQRERRDGKPLVLGPVA